MLSCSSNIPRVRMLPCVKVNNCEKWVEKTLDRSSSTKEKIRESIFCLLLRQIKQFCV